MIADGLSSTRVPERLPCVTVDSVPCIRLLDSWFFILADDVITARNTPPRPGEVVHAGLWTVCLVRCVVQAAGVSFQGLGSDLTPTVESKSCFSKRGQRQLGHRAESWEQNSYLQVT